ncbi:DUF6081 family protein [Cupriavidus necator]
MTSRPLDGLRTGAPDPAVWQVLEMPMPDGGMWRYEEPGARVQAEGGVLEIQVDRFTRQHALIPMFDNPKHFLVKREALTIAEGGVLTVGCEMACENHNGNPDDLFDGFAGFNVCDLANGMVFDFIISGTQIGVVHERLPIPGVTPAGGDWLHVVQSPLLAQNHPGEFHRYEITLDRPARTCTWHVDGRRMYAVRNIVVDIGSVVVGLGLFTLKPAVAGVGSVSNHGQGASGRWRNLWVRSA